MVGYIGPNGAGKSTTLKMLTGVLTPSSGHVRVCALDPVPRRTDLARRIGVVFGHRSQLWWDLPLRESFTLLRHVYRVEASAHAARLSECVELLAMGSFLDTPVRQLSLGQRMRAEITAALLHGPELLFLDEPTIGLDVVSKEAVRAFLAELNARHDRYGSRRRLVVELAEPWRQLRVPGATLEQTEAEGRRQRFVLEDGQLA